MITVPGNDGSEARNLGQTARLYIRPVVHVMPARPAAPQAGAAAGPGADRPRPPPRKPPAEPAGAAYPKRRRAGWRPPGLPAPPPAESPAPQPRPYPQEPPPTPVHRHPRPAPRRAHRRPREPKSAPTWRSASPTKSNCGRAPIRRSSCSPCSSRPPAAARRTCWPATTTRTCRWSPARPTTPGVSAGQVDHQR